MKFIFSLISVVNKDHTLGVEATKCYIFIPINTLKLTDTPCNFLSHSNAEIAVRAHN